ncbi:MAG: 1-deoxy-D-xylulose-5-phosphate reductoisomerase [Fusobacteriaceae bacterium]|nr:1-deoxy-D-xylulose-5-phosphate reductoisomerase [Fusobacteriaceae bacterium]
MKKIIILGSTGSIGTNALEVIRNAKDKFQVIGISGYKNYELLVEQIEEFKPQYVCIGTEDGYKSLKDKFPLLELFYGEKGLVELSQIKDYDILLTAVSGAVGIDATVEGIKNEKTIALANKETMVAAGEYINQLLKKYKNAKIIPVDSEHSAIFQSIQAGKIDEIENLIITASGGTFRGKKKEELQNVTIDQALKHPTWKMGKKITIDSSTLVNKGLEVIEAHGLFGICYDNIKVLIHPQSIIHSMVEFKDKNIIAQLGIHDMKLPIQYAFTYPDRMANPIFNSLDLVKISSLTFEQPDNDVFRGLEFAYIAGKIGETMPVVLNAANEVAVDLFLNKKISFLTIYEIIEKSINRHKIQKITDIDIIKAVDKETREWIKSNYK